MTCPWCGETLLFDEWVRNKKNNLFGYARCEEGDEFLGRFRQRRNRDGSLTVSRSVYEMSDAWWDEYQDALEKQREKEAEE